MQLYDRGMILVFAGQISKSWI